MRVLMLSDVYFPRVNGVSTSIETFRKALAEHDVQVQLVAPRYGNETDTSDVIRIAGRRVPGDPEDRLVAWRAMRSTALALARTADVVHVQTPFAAHYAGVKAARSAGKPVLGTYHTLFEEYLHHYARMLPARWLRHHARTLSRRQCNALDAVIVPSEAMRERLLDYGVHSPMHVLPTGIPVQQFVGGNGAAFRRQHGIDPDRPVALFVGRVAHEKNIGFLLDMLPIALEGRPDLLLVIAGEGPALAELQQRVREQAWSQSVQFIGYLDRQKDLPSCYAAADVFVFASTTETQGLVLLEAMAAGRPVVALAEMGTRDILRPARGCVAPPAQPAAFGQALAQLLNDPGRLQRMAADAREYAQNWSDVTMAARLAQRYRELSETHAPESGQRAIAVTS